MKPKYKAKEKRNFIGLIEIVEIETGKVVKKTKSTFAAAMWIHNNSL